MRTFETLEGYVMEAKVGDKIALEKVELNPTDKNQVYKVVDVFRGKVTIRPYRMRVRIILEEEQMIGLLSNKEYLRCGTE